MSRYLSLVAGAIAATGLSSSAWAINYDTSLADPPGFYNGTGQPNEGFTSNTDGPAEIGLGVLYRNTGPEVHPTALNIYNVATGASTGGSYCSTHSCGLWNIQFSLNFGSTGLHLSDLDYAVLTVTNVTDTVSHSLNPWTGFSDDEGWTGVGNPNVGQHNAVGTDVAFQQSTNLGFPEWVALGFNPNEVATYLVTLSYSVTGDENIYSVSEQINATPIPAALPLFASGLGAFGFLAHRRKRKNAAKA